MNSKGTEEKGHTIEKPSELALSEKLSLLEFACKELMTVVKFLWRKDENIIQAVYIKTHGKISCIFSRILP